MAAVTRLVTLVDLDDDAAPLSLSARHEAELEDGRRLLLLDDRGWSSSPESPSAASGADIEATARVVVGPDEPFDGRSPEDLAADHWAHLTGVLRRQGVVADALELRRLPHDVVLSERLRERVGT